MKILVMPACVVLSSSAFAECTTSSTGRTVCNNGQTAAGYNPNTGNAWKAQKNQAGVTTTRTSKGGEAKTRNGKVYTGVRVARHASRQPTIRAAIENPRVRMDTRRPVPA
jgi:Tfp pilus assembly protein PilX